MSDMIEKVARELRKVKLWDGNPIVSDAQLTDDEVNDLARTAIQAHTAALVEGAGEIAAELVICGEADRTLAHQAAATIAALQAELARVKIALHDAIRRPMGVVPESADEFYSPAEADAAERRRIARRQALSELAAADAVLLDIPEGEPQ